MAVLPDLVAKQPWLGSGLEVGSFGIGEQTTSKTLRFEYCILR